jgi:hypothetical protein
MSLYLCIFDGNEETAAVEVGGYADFDALRQYIVAELEEGRAGSRFPTLILHSDCDGLWSVDDCVRLRDELAAIIAAMRLRPSVPPSWAWQREMAQETGRKPRSALESFLDVDGEVLLEQLEGLVRAALASGRPILFQ